MYVCKSKALYCIYSADRKTTNIELERYLINNNPIVCILAFSNWQFYLFITNKHLHPCKIVKCLVQTNSIGKCGGIILYI